MFFSVVCFFSLVFIILLSLWDCGFFYFIFFVLAWDTEYTFSTPFSLIFQRQSQFRGSTCTDIRTGRSCSRLSFFASNSSENVHIKAIRMFKILLSQIYGSFDLRVATAPTRIKLALKSQPMEKHSYLEIRLPLYIHSLPDTNVTKKNINFLL